MRQKTWDKLSVNIDHVYWTGTLFHNYDWSVFEKGRHENFN